MSKPEGQCRDCKFFNQGEYSAQCFNPIQTDQSLIDYVYYNFGCKLHEEGDQLTESEMNKNGFEKKEPNGDSVSISYYQKRKQ